MRSGVLAVLLGFGLAGAWLSDLAAVAVEPSGARTGERMVLVLDSSGSMAERAAGGGIKIEAAKQALRDVVDRLPDDAQVGMRVFGATVFSADDPGACTDTQRVVPVGPLDRTAIRKQIDSYQPYGETPIGNALRGAAKDLGRGGKRTIVLLSDGEPTCRPDPCTVARQLRRQGVDLRINVVGLDVSGEARRALQCIAKAGGGAYLDVRDPARLADSLVRVSVRALRVFTVTGTPVEGGRTVAQAPEIPPGQYTDRFAEGETALSYRVPKAAAEGLAASVTMRPPTFGFLTLEEVEVRLVTSDGQQCAQGRGFRKYTQGGGGGVDRVLSAGAQFTPGQRDPDPIGCAEAEELAVEVERSQSKRAADFELLLATRPGVEDVSALPGPVSDPSDYDRPARASGRRTDAIGGVSFSDAPTLEPGRYRDTIRPGEQLFYRLPVGWGQAARMTFTLRPDARASALSGAGDAMRAVLYNPVRQVSADGASVGDLELYDGTERAQVTRWVAPVHVRNVESGLLNDLSDQSLAGDYVWSLECDGDPSKRYAVPVLIDVELMGEPAAEPEIGPAAEPVAEPPVEESAADRTGAQDGGDHAAPVVLWWLGGAALIGALATVIAVTVRRGRSG